MVLHDAPSTGPGPDAPGLRSLAYCTLRMPEGDGLGVRRETGILDVRRAARALGVACPASTDELIEG